MEQAFWTGVACVFGAGMLAGILACRALAHYQRQQQRRHLARRRGQYTVDEVTDTINYLMRDEI